MKTQASEQWVTMYPHIDAHLEHCRAAGFSPDTTIPDRREILERLIRTVGDLHTATAGQIAGWLARPGWAAHTRATYFAHIRSYYCWALRRGLVAANPLDDLERPRVPTYMPRGISDAAFATILRDPGEPWLTVALLAGYAGLRCMEVCAARREHIDADSIRVRGKGGIVAEIPTSPVIWDHVRDRPRGLLTLTPKGRCAYRPKDMSHRFAEHCDRLGLHATLHDLRRKYADMLRRAGVDVEVIRTLMRHSSIATTQRYFQPRDEERRAGIQALPAPASHQQEAA